MARYSKQHNKASEQTQEEATELTNAVLKPGQLKEQRKQVQQGIQKGIDLYKKQHKAKSRDLDKRLKKAANTKPEEVKVATDAKVKQRWLPWALLVLSWAGFTAFYMQNMMVRA